MTYVSYFICVFFICLTLNVSAQTTPDLPSETALRSVVLNIELPNENPQNDEKWRESFNRYMQSLKQEYGFYTSPSANHHSPESSTYTQFDNCMKNIGRDQSVNFVDAVSTITSECQTFIKSFSTKYQERLKNEGIDTPEKLARRILQSQSTADQYSQSTQGDDEVIIVDDFTTLEQADFAINPLNTTLNEPTKLLATQVTSILINLYQHNDVQELALENQEAEENQAMLEVIKLGQMIAQINTRDSACEVNLDDEEFTQARSIMLDSLVVHDHKVQIPLTAFFGLSEAKLKKIKAYRVSHQGQEIWLFREPSNGLDETWVMAQHDSTNNSIRYSHFVVRTARQEQLRSSESISLLPQVRAGGAVNNPRSHLLFESEVGLNLKSRSNHLPLAGAVKIPTGQISIASARLRSFGSRASSDTRLDIEVEKVSLRTTVLGNNNNLNISGAASYSNFDDEWQLSAQARIYSMYGGISSNTEKELEYHVGLVVDRNFANLSANQEDINVTVGRQFKNNRGGVSVSSDFKKTANFKLFVFIGR